MPTVFSKHVPHAKNDFSAFVSEFINTFSSSSIGADFFEKVGIDEYNQLLREEERGRKKQRKSRSCFREEKVDYSATKWGRFIADPLVQEPDSNKGKLFRRRFRVPFFIFQFLCNICHRANIFEVKDESRILIPLEIKVLICLRVLGRDECMDSVAEFSEVAENTCNKIFHRFIKNFSEKFQKEYMKI